MIVCKCGCGGEAQYVCHGIDFDPKAPNQRGKPFTVYACRTSSDYLYEASIDLGFPFSRTSLIAVPANADKTK